MKFRQHKGGLEESMATVVELKNRDELTGYIRGLLYSWPSVKADAELISVELYEGNGDPRIGWKEVYIVTLEGYGVLGSRTHCQRLRSKVGGGSVWQSTTK
jgi:hypothetical protein